MIGSQDSAPQPESTPITAPDYESASGSPAEEFLFGPLSRPSGRIAEVRQEGSGFFDLALLEPLDPQPGQPVRLRFRCGVDTAIQRLLVFWSADGSTPAWNDALAAHGTTQVAEASALDPAWDTLNWGYSQDWQLDLPAQAEGTLLRYAAIGIDASASLIPCPWPDRDRHGTPHIAAVVVDRLEPPAWLAQAVIYQVFVDRFAPTPGSSFAPADDLNARLGGTIWGLIDQLDVIAELGIDTLWLTPIFASPQYHGYAVSDFLVIAPELGGQEAWEALVSSCQARGLRIVLDFVANHISDQHAAFQQALLAPDAPTRPWLRFRTWPHDYGCFFDQPHQPELDAEQPEVREHLIAAASHWLGQGCAGFRLDYAHGLSHGFWSQFRNATRIAAPESVCFGEVTHTPQLVRSYGGRLDGCLDFMLCELLRASFARSEMSIAAFARNLERHLAYAGGQLVLPSFLDNHDMNRFLMAASGENRRLRLAAMVQFMLPGPPIIYYGTEVGLSQQRPLGRLEESRLPMPPRDQWDLELRQYYRVLIQLRRQVAPFRHSPKLRWLDDGAGAAQWQIGDFDLLVNCGAERSFAIGAAVPVLGSQSVQLEVNQGGMLSLPAWSAVVLCQG
jgi:glycosidase